MEFTVLQIVQSVLSSLNSDEVNSISDTAESLQVANIAQNVYYNMASRGELPEHSKLIQLNPSISPTNPVVMQVPNEVVKIAWIKYYNPNPSGTDQTDQFGAYSKHDVNTDLQATAPFTTQQAITSAQTSIGNNILFFAPTPAWITVGMTVSDLTTTTAIPSGTTVTAVGPQPNQVTISNNVVATVKVGDSISFFPIPSPFFYEDVAILTVDEFIRRNTQMNPQENDVVTYNFFNFNLRYKNDKKPEYCMALQNQYIVFDSYDSSTDSTLQASKTMCWAQTVPDFLLQDSFVPALDDQQFPLLINETKAWAFYELKQTQHPKAEQETRRQWSALQKNKSVVNKPSYFNQLPNFGRRPYYVSFGPSLRYRNKPYGQ